MEIALTHQIREIDRISINELKIPGIRLMEAAGRGLYKLCCSLVKDVKNPLILIVCGRGNNGGDGFTLGAMLLKSRIKTHVLLACPAEQIKGDAAVWFKNYKKQKGKITKCFTLNQVKKLSPQWFSGYNLIVDALLGTGIKGAPREPLSSLIECINKSGKPIICVDTPSGMDNDTGKTPGVCVQGDYTVTFGLPKLGQFFFPGKGLAGKLIVHDIGFPDKVINSQHIKTHIADKKLFISHIKAPPPTVHKNQRGKVLLIAGSVGYTGAAAMAANAALRSGAGIVRVAAPKDCNSILEIKLTEAITVPMPQTPDSTLSLKALEPIKELIGWADSVILGPGIGLHQETSELVRQLIAGINKPAVLDADGITAFKDCNKELHSAGRQLVITPHRGEFARISDLKLSDDPPELLNSLQSWIQDKHFTLLLKGTPTIVVSSGAECVLSSTGNAGMATAGSGDVLTGIIGAFLARQVSPHFSAAIGALLHGKAGDLAKIEFGLNSMIAGDILNYIPRAFKYYLD
ncbi:MAG: NAD(P)H-hydrate dehydratase [bacterium]